METIKTDSDIIITISRITISGAPDLTFFDAYEPSVGGYASESHSALISLNGVVYGKVSSRRLTPALDALPVNTDDRYAAVVAYHNENKRASYEAIRAACPEARNGREDGMGGIEIWRISHVD